MLNHADVPFVLQNAVLGCTTQLHRGFCLGRVYCMHFRCFWCTVMFLSICRREPSATQEFKANVNCCTNMQCMRQEGTDQHHHFWTKSTSGISSTCVHTCPPARYPSALHPTSAIAPPASGSGQHKFLPAAPVDGDVITSSFRKRLWMVMSSQAASGRGCGW